MGSRGSTAECPRDASHDIVRLVCWRNPRACARPCASKPREATFSLHLCVELETYVTVDAALYGTDFKMYVVGGARCNHSLCGCIAETCKLVSKVDKLDQTLKKV